MASGDDHKRSVEGPEAAKRFESNLTRVLSVTKEELTKREAIYRRSRLKKRPKSRHSK